MKKFLFIVILSMLGGMMAATAAVAAERGVAKKRAPLVVHLNSSPVLVTDGGLMKVTGYLENTTKTSLRYLHIYLTQAANDDPLDITEKPSPGLAMTTKAIGLRYSDGSGSWLAVSLVKPGRHAFTLFIKVPDRMKSEQFRLASFACFRMTAKQNIPGKPLEGFYEDSNGVCGQYVVAAKKK